MQTKLDRILKELYPGAAEYTADQVSFAKRAIALVQADAPRSRIPRTDIPIGMKFYRNGKTYECIRRTPVGLPCEACSGCAFDKSDHKCIGLRCSKFDRSDGNNVWFREVER